MCTFISPTGERSIKVVPQAHLLAARWHTIMPVSKIYVAIVIGHTFAALLKTGPSVIGKSGEMKNLFLFGVRDTFLYL